METTIAKMVEVKGNHKVRPYDRRLFTRLSDKIETALKNASIEMDDLHVTINIPIDTTPFISVSENNEFPSNVTEIEQQICWALDDVGFSFCGGEDMGNHLVIEFED